MSAQEAVCSPVVAVLAGGGTGGHTYPALALAEALVRRGCSRAAIRFVGSQRGIEARAVPEAGFAIDLLPGRGLQRRFTLANVAVVAQALEAFGRALVLLRRLRPRVVVGTGGYASLPTVVAARVLRIPTVVHEQDIAPGLANRIAVRLGARPAVSLPGTPLRGAVVTGNPVRPELAGVVRDPAVPPLLAVYGGSLGSQRLNDAALGLYDRWRARTDVAVRHVSGPRNHDGCAERLAHLRRPDDALAYELVGYEGRMDRLLATCALVVSRAGAGTIAELTVVGVPAVLVPLPGAPADHQARNARTLEDVGAARVVTDDTCTAARLDAETSPLVTDRARLDAMGRAARTLGRPDAAERLADLVEEVAGARR